MHTPNTQVFVLSLRAESREILEPLAEESETKGAGAFGLALAAEVSRVLCAVLISGHCFTSLRVPALKAVLCLS